MPDDRYSDRDINLLRQHLERQNEIVKRLEAQLEESRTELMNLRDQLKELSTNGE